MENIFEKLITTRNYFIFSINIKKYDLYDYLYVSLENNFIRLDLRNALKINANGEYI
jgi:hypothetical protein